MSIPLTFFHDVRIGKWRMQSSAAWTRERGFYRVAFNVSDARGNWVKIRGDATILQYTDRTAAGPISMYVAITSAAVHPKGV